MSKNRTWDTIAYFRPLVFTFVGTLIWLKLIDSYYQTNNELFYLQYSLNDLTISSLALFCLSIWLYTMAIVQPVRKHYTIRKMAIVRSRKAENRRVLGESAKLWLIIAVTTIVWDVVCYGHIFWLGILIAILSYLLSCLLVIRIKLSNTLVILLVLIQIVGRLIFRV